MNLRTLSMTLACLIVAGFPALSAGEIPPPPDVAEAPADAEVTPSGLASRVLRAGTGEEHPAATDIVTVHYTGWQENGKMFDSSVARGEASTFALNRVIRGWGEGLQLMVAGERRRFWIPERLAYPGLTAPYGMLVFDVELIGFEPAPKAPAAPETVAQIPEDAVVTDSGLAYVVLQCGTGTVHPNATSRVTVHYTGWTTGGAMFDSSIPKGAPASFLLNRVIAGWTEGLQLMVAGEKRRFWIPERLAYQGRKAPYGMLVFDIELLDVQ